MAKTEKVKKTVIKGEKNPDHLLIEESAAFDNKNGKNKTFFDKKKIFFLILFFVLSIALLALTIVFILDINFVKLFESMKQGFGEELGALWFILLLCYFFFIGFSIYAGVWPRLAKLGYKIPQWEYWLFGLTISFFRATTPVMFSDPYFIFWLKTKGVPTSRATSILFSNTLLWQIVQFGVTFPSFVMVLISRDALLTNPAGMSAFILLCAGIIIDAFSIAFMILLNMSKNIHYFMSRCFNWVKQKLHMQYHTKEETKEKYKNKAVMKEQFIEYMKDWKTTLLILGILIVGELILYFAVNWALFFMSTYNADGQVYNSTFNFWQAFNCANVTFTANRLNFIAPNGEGSLQFLLSTFLVELGGFKITPVPGDVKEITTGIVNNAILVWRVFGAYLPALFGLGALIGLTTIQARRYKKHHKIV
ncbi:MAG: hypothetical protein ACOQNY_02695 [Mycoplasmoidaceae bacterium]